MGAELVRQTENVKVASGLCLKSALSLGTPHLEVGTVTSYLSDQQLADTKNQLPGRFTLYPTSFSLVGAFRKRGFNCNIFLPLLPATFLWHPSSLFLSMVHWATMSQMAPWPTSMAAIRWLGDEHSLR